MKKDKDDNIFDKTEDSLEAKLLRSYIIGQTVWAAFNFLASIFVHMPPITVETFLVLAVALPLGYFAFHKIGKGKVFEMIYLLAMFLAMPVVWYVVGGPRTSGNILFVAELQLFTMCTRGKKQKILVVMSLISISLLTSMVGRFPNVVLMPLPPELIGRVGPFFGLSTSLLIVFLLLKNKDEYVKERRIVLETQEELRASNRLQKNFLANMSHEIRSPLGIVLGFNDLISETDDVKKIHEYSKNIQKTGKLLQVVINDILDYSKIESGKLDIISVDYSIYEMLDEVCKEIELSCNEKNLEFKFTKAPDVPQFLFGDNIRIRQCLTNVLANAVKYTDEGCVELDVEGKMNPTNDKCRLKFVVKDTGRGMQDELLDKLFTSFQRLDEGQNRGIEGTGLGLAITKSLLNEMGGEIDVESTYGEGSTFTISITQPIGNPVEPKSKDKPKEVDRQLKILYVDDAKMNIRLLETIMKKYNFKVLSVDSGAKCLEELKKAKFDVVLLDHMMPEMDGVETFKRFREDPGINENTPVVMVTANAMTGVEKEYMDMGFAGYISKPINRNDLINTIMDLCKDE